MAEQAGNRTVVKKLSRNAAQNPFTKPTMAVRAGDDQIGLGLLRKTHELAPGRSRRRDSLGACVDPMAVEERLRIVERSSVSANLEQVHLLGAFQERQSVRKGAPCPEGVFPADKDIANIQPATTRRYDQNRPADTH